MTLKDLHRIISSWKEHKQSAEDIIEANKELEISGLWESLRIKYNIVKQVRLDKWNKKGLGRDPTHQEQIQDTEFEEWSYYFAQYLTKIPEQLYQEVKLSPLEHDSSWYMRNLEGYDNQGCNQFTGCIPECKFYNETGRIEYLEILDHYKDYVRYSELREIFKE